MKEKVSKEGKIDASSLLPQKKRKTKNIFLKDPVIARHFSPKKTRILTRKEKHLQVLKDFEFALIVKQELDRIHANEFAFHCSYCEEKFEENCHLDAHVKSKHEIALVGYDASSSSDPDSNPDVPPQSVFDILPDTYNISNEENEVEDQLNFNPTAANLGSTPEVPMSNANFDLNVLREQTSSRIPSLNNFLEKV